MTSRRRHDRRARRRRRAATTRPAPCGRSHYGPDPRLPGLRVDRRADHHATATPTSTTTSSSSSTWPWTRPTDLDEFSEVHADITGMPLFNTIAVSADGRAWYADTSATPNLSARGARRLRGSAEPTIRSSAWPATTAPSCSTAATRSTSGSTIPAPATRAWCPTTSMPMVERDDYVFNANDSFWLPNATELLDRRLLAAARRARTPPARRAPARTPRCWTTRGRRRPRGDDGTLRPRRAGRRGVGQPRATPRARCCDEVVERCDGRRRSSSSPSSPDGDGGEALPAGTVDVAEACDVLGGLGRRLRHRPGRARRCGGSR